MSEKRSASQCFNDDANGKHVKKRNDDEKDEEEQPQPIMIESLQKLAARATARYLIDARRHIPREAAAVLSDRRNALYQQLDELDQEKARDIEERTKKLDAMQEYAMESFTDVGGVPDKYCSKCLKFYQARNITETEKCTVEGCMSHMKCLECDAGRKPPRKWVHSGHPVDEDELSESEICFEQYKDYPSKTGYLNCWICTARFCNDDFVKHYKTCRSKVSHRCGFRPPTGLNEGEKYVCVPGHCGKEIEEGEEEYICYPEDGLCCTVSCRNCITICQREIPDCDFLYGSSVNECGQARCKQCAHTCWGSCLG